MYGTAPITDTWTIWADEDRIDLVCNAFSYGKGSFVGDASITALKVADVVK